MKFNKIAKKFAAAALAGVLMVSSMGMTASAEGSGNVDVDNSVSVSFTKTLDMSAAEGASVPNVTFRYSITAGEAVDATENNDVKTPEILAGVGTPIVGTAAYTSSDTAGSSVEKTVSVDFSSVTFDAPGIYRYVITEEKSSVAGVTDDTNNTRYLDVYVTNGDTTGTYVISSYMLLTTAETPTLSIVDGKTQAAYASTAKSDGYTNSYTTQSLTLRKTVEGDMADMSKEFDFTISFTGGPANGSFTYSINNGTSNTLTLDAAGAGSITGIKLNNTTGSLVITGIPEGVTYKITENINSTEGYTTTYVINSDSETTATSTGDQTVAEEDVSVTFKNTKEAITPTGIALSIAPYVLMVAFAGVIAVLFLRKRKYEI